MTKYLAMIYLALYVLGAIYFASFPDPQEAGPFSFPSLTTNYIHGAP